MEHLREYLKAARGNLTSLANSLGITPGAITQWDKVPADRVVEIERATGIPRQKLRPDIFDGMVAAE